MNIQELADALKVSWPTTQKLASGAPTTLRMNDLLNLCDLFDCTPGDLLKYMPEQRVVSPETD